MDGTLHRNDFLQSYAWLFSPLQIDMGNLECSFHFSSSPYILEKSTFAQYTVIILHTSKDCTAKEKGSFSDLIKGKSTKN